jgi:hypothetical protein
MTLRRKLLVVDLGLFVVLLVIVAVMALDGETLAAVTSVRRWASAHDVLARIPLTGST